MQMLNKRIYFQVLNTTMLAYLVLRYYISSYLYHWTLPLYRKKLACIFKVRHFTCTDPRTLYLCSVCRDYQRCIGSLGWSSGQGHCCVFGQDSLLSWCLFLPSCINRYCKFNAGGKPHNGLASHPGRSRYTPSPRLHAAETRTSSW